MHTTEPRHRALTDPTPLPGERSPAVAGDIPPPLEWTAVPGDAVEPAPVRRDPDAPSGMPGR